jgi:hypothetical protein
MNTVATMIIAVILIFIGVLLYLAGSYAGLVFVLLGLVFWAELLYNYWK